MSDLGFTHVWQERTGPRTLLLLHGTGGDERDLLPLGALLDPEAHLLSPRGKVLERGMPRFFRRFAEGVLDLEDAALRAGELADFVGRAAAQYGFDPSRLVAVGFSNGANIALATMLASPGVLPAVAAIRGMVTLEPSPPPALAGTRVLLANGRHDPLVPPGQADQLEGQFRAAGAEVTVSWALAGHQLTQADLTAVRDWLG